MSHWIVESDLCSPTAQNTIGSAIEFVHRSINSLCRGIKPYVEAKKTRKMDFNSASKHASSNSLDSDSKSSSLNSKHGVDTMVSGGAYLPHNFLFIQNCGPNFDWIQFLFTRRLPTTHRSHICPAKSDRTSRMMLPTFVRTVVPSVAPWPSQIIVCTFGRSRATIDRRMQRLWSMCLWAWFRVLKRSAVPVREARTPMASISFARICETYASPTVRRIIRGERFSRNCKCTRFRCRTMSGYLHFPMRNFFPKTVGMFMSRLQSCVEW